MKTALVIMHMLYAIVVVAGWIFVVFVLDYSAWWTLVFMLFMSVEYNPDE